MNLDRWPEIKALLGEVLECQPAERERFLADYAPADEELKREVAALMNGGPDEQRFLIRPSDSAIASPLRVLSLAFTGCSIGDYELVEEIGRGSSGTVYRAKQVSLGRPAAVKILAHHLCASEQARERFRREAEAASKLRHESIVSVYSFGEQNGAFYIAMEFVPGSSLRDLILDRVASQAGVAEPKPNSDLDISDPLVAAGLVEKLARGLHHSHERGVLHRDVKPENIVIDGKGQPRLVDFGLAKDCALSELTKTGMISGTPHYMSPEQARAIGSLVDRRTDIYSLGVVLYELVSRQRPFEFVTPGDLLHAIGHEEPRSLALAWPAVPSGLAAVCMKAIAKLPDQRYATAAAMADDLQLFLNGKRTHARGHSRSIKLRELAVRHRALIAAGLLIACLGLFSDALRVQGVVKAGQPNVTNSPAAVHAMREGFEESIKGMPEPERLKERKNFNEYLKKRIRDNEGR